MKIGVNYLTEVKELFEEGKIDFIDYFKLYSLNTDTSGANWCIKNRWLMFHGLIGKSSQIGNKNLISKIDIEQTKDILVRGGSPYLSCHIAKAPDEYSKEETLKNISENIKNLKETFNMDILLENIPFRDRYMHEEFLLDPEVISRIIYENDVNYLFDISHAKKSAEHFNMSLEEYVEKLPMDRVIEFHLAGMYDFLSLEEAKSSMKYTKKQLDFIEFGLSKFGKRADNHGKMNEEDYLFLENAISKYKSLKYITLEYGSINTTEDFNDEDFTYPVCRFDKSNIIAKNEVLEQLIRINKIVKGNVL